MRTKREKRAPIAAVTSGIEVSTYRVSIATGDWGRLLSARGAASGAARCFARIRGRAEPCEGCPLLGFEGEHARAYGVLAGTGDAYELAGAAREGDVAVVHLLRLSDEVVSAMCAEKLRKLAARAQLSPRETSVLELMVLGARTKEIASALAISTRTAKFHGVNLLRKLGADSRLTLLRMLLDGREAAPQAQVREPKPQSEHESSSKATARKRSRKRGPRAGAKAR